MLQVSAMVRRSLSIKVQIIETAVIRAVGTPGATVYGTASGAGATAITVAGLSGFSVGQTITIGSGANAETATIATLTPARGRIGSANYNPVNSGYLLLRSRKHMLWEHRSPALWDHPHHASDKGS